MMPPREATLTRMLEMLHEIEAHFEGRDIEILLVLNSVENLSIVEITPEGEPDIGHGYIDLGYEPSVEWFEVEDDTDV